MFTRITIDPSFKKAYKIRQKAGDNLVDVDEAFIKVVKKDKLPDSYKNHELSGDLKGTYCIHVRGDLLILYIPDSNGKDLHFLDLGTHHQLLKR